MEMFQTFEIFTENRFYWVDLGNLPEMSKHIHFIECNSYN